MKKKTPKKYSTKLGKRSKDTEGTTYSTTRQTGTGRTSTFKNKKFK